MDETLYLTVETEDEGSRLDAFVASQLEETSRSLVQKWIEADRVWVDGETRKASFSVSAGQEIKAKPLPPQPSELVPEEIPLEILHEDESLIIVDKPAGMVVHPGAGNWSGTLANALVFHFQKISRAESLRPGIVHRLDKGTSGVMVVAKDEYAHDFLATQFQRRMVKKTYLALLYGRLAPPEGEIDVSIGRDRKSRLKISPRTNNPKRAVTRYVVDRYWEDFTFVRAFPETGRTHQIRVHFQHAAHPVVGDDLYARGHRSKQRDYPFLKSLDRLFLHATSIEICHPKDKKMYRFESPLPAELEEIVRSLGE